MPADRKCWDDVDVQSADDVQGGQKVLILDVFAYILGKNVTGFSRAADSY